MNEDRGKEIKALQTSNDALRSIIDGKSHEVNGLKEKVDKLASQLHEFKCESYHHFTFYDLHLKFFMFVKTNSKNLIRMYS